MPKLLDPVAKKLLGLDDVVEEGSDVMRRASVAESRQSGFGHVRGVVLRIRGERCLVRWTSGHEEEMSRRRAQRFADAFAELPTTHDFRRKTSRPTLKTPTIAFHASKKRRSKDDDDDDDRRKNEEPAAEPTVEIPSLDEDTTTSDNKANAAVEEEEPRAPPPPPPPEEEPEDATPEESPNKRRKLSLLRNRKCSPGVKIEWHGGKGHGGIEQTWVEVADGKFISQKDLNNKENERHANDEE
eukprot:CAMPEP_0118905982 /NCGR_PEP_ID=MMETSP1166-20130328/9720_1 /TAXON_ID=1104430 /ORGANISM="Chrysoreinhardia sp, Strain CCMP3193" /LENGTH=241 /DNA_ID=CAMNT_0006845253 /DNA_START=126 /DNA_END=851 /DNA_ORIENTATION=-